MSRTEEHVTKKVSIVVDRSKYVKTKTGLNNGDEVAQALEGKDLDTVYAFVADQTAVSEDELRAKYGKHNPGMQRMFLGNRLRGKINADKKATEKARAAESAAIEEAA